MPKSAEEKLDDQRIMKLFRGRCIVCMSAATEIHEIIPRSKTKHATKLPNNRVPLCNGNHKNSHRDVHDKGYTLDKADFLRVKAIERLIIFGVDLHEW